MYAFCVYVNRAISDCFQCESLLLEEIRPAASAEQVLHTHTHTYIVSFAMHIMHTIHREDIV